MLTLYLSIISCYLNTHSSLTIPRNVSCNSDSDCFRGRCVDRWCECDEGWNLVRNRGCYELTCNNVTLGGSCYYIDPQQELTWFTARDKCQETGFDLVSISTQTEEDALQEYGVNKVWMINRAIYTDDSGWQIKGNSSYKDLDDDLDVYDLPMLCLGTNGASFEYKECSLYHSTDLLCERPIIFSEGACYDDTDCSSGYVCFGWHCELNNTNTELVCSFNLPTAALSTTSIIETTEYVTTRPTQKISTNSTVNVTFFDNSTTPYTTTYLPTTVGDQTSCHIDNSHSNLFPDVGTLVVNDGIHDNALHFNGLGNFAAYLYNMPCPFLPHKCVSGLTVSLWIKPTLTELQDDSTAYFVSSGAPNRTGFAIYRKNKDIYMTVNNGENMWETVINHATPDLMADVWSNIAFTWAPKILEEPTTVEPELDVTLAENATLLPITLDSTTQIPTEAPFADFVLSAFLDGKPVSQSTTISSFSVKESVRMLVIGAYYDADLDVFDHSMVGLFDELAISDENSRTGIDLLRGVDLDVCKTMNDCDNGTCFTSNGEKECRCFAGFEGDMCESDIRECDSSPCFNGTCVEESNQFTCDCYENWGGTLCQNNLCPAVNYAEDVKELTFYNISCNETNTEFVNPVYSVAQHYPTLSEVLAVLPEGVVESTGLGRGGACTTDPVLTSSSASFEPGIVSETCIDSPLLCTKGFAISMWMKIERDNLTMNANLSGVIIHSKKAEEGFVIELTERQQLVVKLFGENASTNKQTATTQFPFVEGIWFNVGVSWRSDLGAFIYVNGIRQQTSVNELSMTIGGDSDTKLTIGGLGMSIFPLVVSDLVIWNRYLFEFESYRFIGVTASEWLYLLTSKYYIPTDKFIRRDHADLLNMTTGTTHLLRMHVPSTVHLSSSTGRDAKGSALELRGSTYSETLFSDELPNTCLSDPSQCNDGLSVSMWTKIYEPDNDKYAFIFSSGEQASRGISMYIRARQRLGVAVADGDNRWIIDLDFIPDATVWMHLAFSWHKEIGLFLYINGKLRGLDNVGYRKIRADDLHYRLTIGRRNDVNCMQSHIIFEDFAFFEKFIAPYEAMTLFGFPDTRNFDNPLLFYNAKTFIGSDLDDLDSDDHDSFGVSGDGVSVITVEPETVEYLQLNESEIVLRMRSDSQTCFNDPELCEEGISLSVWVKLDENMNIIQSSGISVSVEDGVLVCSVEVSEELFEARRNINLFSTGKWINIAFTWSELNSLNIYINGVLFDSELETLEKNSHTSTIIGEETDPGLAIYNLAFWERFTYSRHAAKFLGVTESQVTCIKKATYCWPFESAITLLHPYTVSASGTLHTMDRTKEGRAIATDGVSGWVSLGHFDGCPADPSLCNAGFALSMWLKLLSKNVNGHIFSVGGKNTTKGVWVQQSAGDVSVEVADGTSVWKVDIPAINVTYNQWFRLGFSSSTAGLSVSINGKAFSLQNEVSSATGRSTKFSKEMVLGKVSGLDESYVKAEYDEVELYLSSDVTDLPDSESLSGIEESVEYETADEYYKIVEEAASNETKADGVLHYTQDDEYSEFNYVDLGDFAGLCLSVLERCSSAGVTISVWFQPTTSTFTNRETHSEGLGYIISSGAQSNDSTGFAVWYDGTAIAAVAKNNSYQWQTAALFPFVENTWTNVGFSWSRSSGIALFIDGKLESSDLVGNTSKPCENDIHTKLILGKRNDAHDGFINALFRDPAIWYYDVTSQQQDPGGILKGENPDEIIVTDNHAELDALSSFIGQECNVIHDADCARDLQELLSIINGEEELTPELVESVKLRLLTFTEEQYNFTVNDLSTILEIFEFLVNSPITGVFNETSATDDLQDFLTIVSKSLEEENQPEWLALQEIRPGTSSIIEDLEDYVMKVSALIREADGHNYMRLTSPEIIVEIRSFPIESFDEDGFIYPFFNEESFNDDENSTQFWEMNRNRIKLPKNLFTFTEPGQVASIVFTLYNSLETVFPNITSEKFYKTEEQKPVLNSKIISVSVNPPLRLQLYNPFTLVMEHLANPEVINNETTFKPVCAFWNYDLRNVEVNNSDGAWDKQGCDVIESNETFTKCDCYHFTSFAIFMEPEETISIDDEIRIMWIMIVLSATSIIMLIVLIAYYLLKSRLKTVMYSINLNLCWAVFFNAVGLIVSGILKDNETACRFIGLGIHTTLLSVINWLLVGSIHIYYTFQDNDPEEKPNHQPVKCFSEKFSLYFVVGWGIPLMISATTFFVIGDNGYGKQARGLCFLSEEDSSPVAMTVPLVVASLIIFLVFYVVMRNMNDEMRRLDYTTSYRSGIKGGFILTLYLCVTWVFGSIGLYGNTIWMDYLFSVFISLLGVAVFCIQGFLNKEVHAILCWLDPDVELTEIQKIEIKPEPTKEIRPKLVYHP